MSNRAFVMRVWTPWSRCSTEEMVRCTNSLLKFPTARGCRVFQGMFLSEETVLIPLVITWSQGRWHTAAGVWWCNGRCHPSCDIRSSPVFGLHMRFLFTAMHCMIVFKQMSMQQAACHKFYCVSSSPINRYMMKCKKISFLLWGNVTVVVHIFCATKSFPLLPYTY